MTTALLIALVVLAAFACPAMMWWQNRRGRAAACCIPARRRDRSESESPSGVDALRRRQAALGARITELERERRQGTVARNR